MNFFRNINKERKTERKNYKRTQRENKENEIESCVICFYHYSPKSDSNKGKNFLPCCHAFCNECTNAWKRKSNTCPICREPIISNFQDTQEDNIFSMLKILLRGQFVYSGFDLSNSNVIVGWRRQN